MGECRTAGLVDTALELWAHAGHTHYVPIQGRSMLPFIRAGDEVLIAHQHDDVVFGDIVVFRAGNKLIAHRVLRVDPRTGHITTGGDNTTYFDDPVTHADIIGRVIGLRRAGRTVSLNSRMGRRLGRLIAAGSLLIKYLAERGKRDSRIPRRIMRLGRRCTVTPLNCAGTILTHIFYRWDG